MLFNSPIIRSIRQLLQSGNQLTSRSKRMPKNCQHVLAGKKLRKLARIRSLGIVQEPSRSTYWFTIDLLSYSPTAVFHMHDMDPLAFAGFVAGVGRIVRLRPLPRIAIKPASSALSAVSAMVPAEQG
ncbi:MAG: hypothetical protein ABIR00_04830 [Nitrosospira sp.]